ncbi:UPF0158 family protein [Paenibacillus chondroitinus]|uniref:UPF0158 family protein n=1 Tax=Paenibacillus chondroitinus TaxID=59842 RepID=A0ABU6DG36_9BACL|nr:MULTISPECIES: UPF0158 family protein [Paenibacillus]MCY9662661.1 UPF0158 family protein [Paenibacillus anseongense]MEB4796714.1 UPF0158 family protein [Paenibacillus chondroitinus]
MNTKEGAKASMHKMKPVKLDDLVGEIEMQIDDTLTFINITSGEVITLTREEYRAAEDEKPLDKFPEWQRENIEKAIRIIEDEEEIYVDFTLKNDFNEYEIIEDFIGTLEDGDIREELFVAIQGRGAFRRFKDGIIEHGVDKLWYEYKESKIKDFVIEWCKDNDIEIQA